MNLLVIDAQGGGIGKQVVAAVKKTTSGVGHYSYWHE